MQFRILQQGKLDIINIHTFKNIIIKIEKVVRQLFRGKT